MRIPGHLKIRGGPRRFRKKYRNYSLRTLGFTTMGLAANLALATSIPMTDLRQYINSDLVFNDLKLQILYSKIATCTGRYIQHTISYVGLVAIPGENPLDLATSIWFSNLDPFDGGWSQNPMQTILPHNLYVSVMLTSLYCGLVLILVYPNPQ